MSVENGKRITVKLKTPNPLFEKWITEWRDKAHERGSKMYHCFNLALQSLKKYPLPLETGRDCKILKGFGNKLCQMLDNNLKNHRNGESSNVNITNIRENKKTTAKRKHNISATNFCPQYGSGSYGILITIYEKSLEPGYPGFLKKAEIIEHGQQFVTSSFTKPDIGCRYTAWSSMATLISKNLVNKRSNPAKFSLTDEGLKIAKKLYENSRTSINANLSEIPSLEMEQIISMKYGNCQRFENTPVIDLKSDVCNEKSLSFSGIPCTMTSFENNEKQDIFRLQKLKPTKSNELPASSSQITTVSSTQSYSHSKKDNYVGDIDMKSKTIQRHESSCSTSSAQSSIEHETVIFSPGSFDIILYVDTNETSGNKNSCHGEIIIELNRLKVCHEIKDLKVGDFTWVCRERKTNKELILPYIVERKRMDDLASSIKDGRYHEQKFRLKQSRLENIIYLIENYGKNNHHIGLPLSNLYQAATNTFIQDGFFVKHTENVRATGWYLANFSKSLIKLYQSKTIVSCPKENIPEVSLDDDLIYLMTFEEFNKTSIKNQTLSVSDMFINMLLQIHGVSNDCALAITEKYPTPKILNTSFEEAGDDGEKLLANIRLGNKKSVGAVISKIIYQLFTKNMY